MWPFEFLLLQGDRRSALLVSGCHVERGSQSRVFRRPLAEQDFCDGPGGRAGGYDMTSRNRVLSQRLASPSIRAPDAQASNGVAPASASSRRGTSSPEADTT